MNNIDVSTLVAQLKIARDFYYRGQPIMSDNDFDRLENTLRGIDPENEYFSTVGAEVRGEKVKHTIPMGSLDQVDDQTFLKWIKTSESSLVGTDKLDGNSIAIYYGIDGEFEAAVTRGDGIEGLDITRHIRRMLKRKNRPIPPIISISGTSVVRCEAIIRKDLFEKHVKGYKNPRNYVAGQLNRTVADESFIEYVDLVAFDADWGGYSKTEILDTLARHNFKVVPYYSLTLDANMPSLLEERKRFSPYELDGIVVDFNDWNTRSTLGFNGLNPRYAVKYKINADYIETEVVDVVWSPSKDGYLKPRVNFEPVDLAGVTISFATGFNAKFILDNKIGPGAIVKITRSGEVIPYISQVVSPAETAAMPKNYEDIAYWTDTGVDLVLYEKPDESHIKEIVEFFTSIDAPMLKLGNVSALYEAGFTTIADIIKMTEEELVSVLGENGTKAFIGMRDKLTDINEYDLAGSLPIFGRGIGKRKMRALAELHGDITKLTYDEIIDTPGFDEKTSDKVANGVPLYIDFLNEVKDYVTVKKYEKIQGDLNGIAVAFTGIRDATLHNRIEERGGKVLASATKQMTHLIAKDPNAKSGKLDKARKQGVAILSIEEARELWG